MSKLVLGIDVGTQGARVAVVDETGCVVAQASEFFPTETAALPKGYVEQDPEGWWRAVRNCLLSISPEVKDRIVAVAVDSTSGTILAIDGSGRALRPAIMYNDGRAQAEADFANCGGRDHCRKLGYQFNSSFGLPKILWVKQHEPQIYVSAERFIHAADFIVGRLTGEYGFSDSSNALKTGCDLAELNWPEFILKLIPPEKLPVVLAPGEILARVSENCAAETGMPTGTKVAAGVSDGTAGFIASGAAAVGDWNTTLGTTLVMRGISSDAILDPMGRFYSHRHPDGWWLPGGASNVGGEALSKLFPGEDLDELAAAAADHLPTGLIVYPLVRRGERLPFIDAEAEGFVLGETRDRAILFAAYLEGVAFVERWILETAAELGAQTDGGIFTTGGGAKSRQWMRIRAGVLNRRVSRPAVTECAMGAAIVAASRTLYPNLTEASRNMARPDLTIDPDPALAFAYDHFYHRFREECSARFNIP